jgi:hypothetical protein
VNSKATERDDLWDMSKKSHYLDDIQVLNPAIEKLKPHQVMDYCLRSLRQEDNKSAVLVCDNTAYRKGLRAKYKNKKLGK